MEETTPAPGLYPLQESLALMAVQADSTAYSPRLIFGVTAVKLHQENLAIRSATINALSP